MELITIPIPSDTPGTSAALQFYRLGADSAGQSVPAGGSHADEQPGMLTHHLLPMLAAAKTSRLNAKVVIMPWSTPLAAHLQFHAHRGRYHPVLGLNYNRGWVDLDAELFCHAGDLTTRLGSDAAANKTLVLDLLREWHAGVAPVTALEHLRHAVTAGDGC